MSVEIQWLGRIPYRDAWARQHALVMARAAGEIPDQLLLLEHPAVLTLGRHADQAYVRATSELLAARAIEVIRVERGGEVTYHGPGQLVGYPIVRLADRGLLIQPFVRLLEAAMIETAARYGVAAGRRSGLPGVWCDPDGPLPRKLGALGLRVEHGVTYHGVALNLTTDLADFAFIDPCGMPGADVTSIAREAGWDAGRSMPSTASVEEAARTFGSVFTRLLDDAAMRQAEAGHARAVAHVPPERDGGVPRHAPAVPVAGDPRAAMAAPGTAMAGGGRASSTPGG
jgi:lipoyl(octanoyl) transferase